MGGFTAGGAAVLSGVIAPVIPRPAGDASDMIVNNDAKGPRLDPASDKVVDDAIGETEREAVTTNGTIIDAIPDGDRAQADEDFDEMDLNGERNYSTPKGEVRTGTLPDGSRVTVCPSADGRPTIQIDEQNENGKAPRGRTREIRYGNND